MNHLIRLAITVTVIFVVMATTALAQRGMGDTSGVVRQGLQPQIVTFAGTLVEVKTGPCEATTGRSPIGTHLILATADGRTLNVHLGPAVVVAPTVAKLVAGQPISVRGFRTDKMPENHFVAQSLTFGETTVALRNENLQPVWAQGPARGRGRGAARDPGGIGPRKGMGPGRANAPGTPRGPAHHMRAGQQGRYGASGR